MDKQKRKRSENWDSSQKILLRQLVEEKIEIVENKSVDKSKREAWAEILINFNKVSQIQRDLIQLQTQWKAIKMKAKPNQSDYKRSRNATGGGPPPKSPDSEEERLISLIPHEFEVDENQFDCDFSDSMVQKENVSPVKITDNVEASTSRTPLFNISQDYVEVEFLEQEIPGSFSPPSHPTPIKKKQPKKVKEMKDEELKMKLFEASMESKKHRKEIHGRRPSDEDEAATRATETGGARKEVKC